MTSPTRLLTLVTLSLCVSLVRAEEAFVSGGFARAPEGALVIANAPAPLFRDPVFNGAADPSLVWHEASKTAKVVSADLKNWTRIESVSGQDRHEAPVVLFWKDKFWLFIDEWKGIAVYQSDDGIQYTRKNLILDQPGKRLEDGYFGSHPGVALAGDRAFIFYHCHHGKTIGEKPAPKEENNLEYKLTSLQVAELEIHDGKMTCDRDN